MSKLVPPHGSDELMPLLLPETERAESAAAGTGPHAGADDQPRDLGLHHAGHGSLYAARRLHGQGRLARRLRRHAACRWLVLADPDHAVLPRRELADSIAIEETVALVDQDSGEIMGMLEVTEKIHDRQSIRVPARLPHDRPETSGRGQGHGAGRGQSRAAASRR